LKGALGDGGFSRDLKIVFKKKLRGYSKVSNDLDDCGEAMELDLSPCDAYVPKIV
jgi:hypothetical protein